MDQRVQHFTSQRLDENPHLGLWLLVQKDKVKTQSSSDAWVQSLSPEARATLALLLVEEVL